MIMKKYFDGSDNCFPKYVNVRDHLVSLVSLCRYIIYIANEKLNLNS